LNHKCRSKLVIPSAGSWGNVGVVYIPRITLRNKSKNKREKRD
jgi:hypothetical protein